MPENPEDPEDPEVCEGWNVCPRVGMDEAIYINEATESDMRVIINFHSYEQTPYDVQQDTTISELKQMIQDVDGTPAANFELFFEHQKLENAMSLIHYNIHDGALLDIKGDLNPSLHPRYINNDVQGRRMDNMLSKLQALM